MAGTINTVVFNPPPPPDDPRQLQRYLSELNVHIGAALALVAKMNHPVVHVAPSKPRDGDPVHADGSNFNPGSGKGLYIYKASTATWVLVVAL